MRSATSRGPCRHPLAGERDVVLARRRLRSVIRRLGFGRFDERRILAAVTELALCAVESGREASVSATVTTDLPPALQISVSGLDPGDLPGIAATDEPQHPNPNGHAAAWRRSVREWSAVPSQQGVAVRISEPLPSDQDPPMSEEIDELFAEPAGECPAGLLREFAAQNREILDLLDEMRHTRDHNQALDEELKETNRGVLALYSDLEANAEQLRELNETLEQRVAERTAVAEHRTAQLRTLAAELAQAEQRERRRVAQVLHDHLQQLLIAAKMNIGVLRKDAVSEKLHELIDGIAELLDESITASRTLTVELSPPILYDRGLAAALDWLGRWMHEKHGLSVEIEADERAEPAAEEERSLLFEIARELLLNVVKHAGTDRAWLRLSRTGEDQVELVVRDRGRGFDASDFNRGESSSSGFGLSSVRRRLELLGGEMTIDSAPGEGTETTVRAPIRLSTQAVSRSVSAEPDQAAAGPDEAPAPQDEPPPSGRIRVLLADDHKILREGLVMLLARHSDIEIVGEASDGRTAVEMTRQLRPDVVVMDVNMPDINGLAATHHITTELPQTNVIGLSLHAEADMARAMYDAGAKAYLTKGGPSDELLAAIRDAAG